MKRAFILGGTFDGARFGLECDRLPFAITLDGQAYELVGRCYREVQERWRPFTAKRKAELVAHVARGETISRACKLVAVSSAAVYRHRRIDEHFRRALERARDGHPVDEELPATTQQRSAWRASSPVVPLGPRRD